MGNDRRSANIQHALNISDAGAIHGQLYNLFMGIWIISVAEAIKLEALTTIFAQKSLLA